VPTIRAARPRLSAIMAAIFSSADGEGQHGAHVAVVQETLPLRREVANQVGLRACRSRLFSARAGLVNADGRHRSDHLGQPIHG
jgi:hypothetical protein